MLVSQVYGFKYWKLSAVRLLVCCCCFGVEIIILHLVHDVKMESCTRTKNDKTMNLVQDAQNLLILAHYVIICNKICEVIYLADTEKKFNATEYKNKFQKEKYDRLIVNVPKGQKEVITSYAKENGFSSLNAFVVAAINEKMSK